MITGASDDDPSGIATYSQAGAQYGNQFVANTINLAADLGAMAAALKLLIGGPSLLYVVGLRS